MRSKRFERVLIIADDFTGANDTAVKFANLGFSVITTLDISDIPRLFEEFDVVAVDTESRALKANKAYELLTSLGAEIRTRDDVLIYKKIDSTLRGNIISEIKGLYDVVESSLIIFAPAFPKQDRITINGIQFVGSTPVEKIFFSKNIEASMKYSNIPSNFKLVFKNAYHHISLKELRSGKIQINFDTIRILSFDAQTDEDLKIIIQKIMPLSENRKIIWTGSAGLAEYLAYSTIIGRRTGKPTLLIVGSINILTQKQVRNFANECKVEIIQVNINELLKNYKEEEDKIVEKVAKAIESLSDIIITTSYDQNQIYNNKTVTSKFRLNMLEFSSILSNKIGELVSSIIKTFGEETFSSLFITGGDTAVSVIKHLGINSIEIKGEVEPGLPILKYEKIDIVTKAGGFGNKDSLIKVTTRLKKK
jgi:uncharacterized protein YgbK (DUF1537 family)